MPNLAQIIDNWLKHSRQKIRFKPKYSQKSISSACFLEACSMICAVIAAEYFATIFNPMADHFCFAVATNGSHLIDSAFKRIKKIFLSIKADFKAIFIFISATFTNFFHIDSCNIGGRSMEHERATILRPKINVIFYFF